MSDPADQAPRQDVHLPAAEILAVVVVDRVPDSAPPALSGLVVARTDDAHNVVDWKLSAAATLHSGIISEYWSWRRRWTASWSIGPTSNVLCLLEQARRGGHALGADLQSVLDWMCTADYEDVAFDPADFIDLIPQLDDLREALAEIDVNGLAMIDNTPGTRNHRVLRRWATTLDEVVLTANAHAEVVLRRDGGLVVVSDGDSPSEFAGIVQVDLAGEDVVIVNETGRQLRLPPAHGRPLAWLAPSSLRWSVREIPVVDVWAPLFDGLSRAVDAALGNGQLVSLTSAFTTV